MTKEELKSLFLKLTEFTIPYGHLDLKSKGVKGSDSSISKICKIFGISNVDDFKNS